MKKNILLIVFLISIVTINVEAKDVSIYFYPNGGTLKTKDFKITNDYVTYKDDVNHATYKDTETIKDINSIKAKNFVLKKNGTYQVDGKEWYAYNDTTNRIYYFDERETYKVATILSELNLNNDPNPVITMFANWEDEEESNDTNSNQEKSISLKVNKKVISIKENLNIDVLYNPSNSQEEKIIWSSSNDKVAKVYKGVVTGLSKGTTTITAKTKSNLKASIKIKVTDTKKHYVYIKLNANNSILNEVHGEDYSIMNNSIYKNNNNIIHKIEYNAKMSEAGLTNYNNENYLNVEKQYYKAIEGKEWNTKPDGSGKSYDQTKIYKASDFCNAYKKDCEVTLYVNWKKTSETLHLGTFNVGFFNCGSSKYDCNPTASDFSKLIKNNNIDIIGLQEARLKNFYLTKKAKEESNKTIASIGTKAGLKYNYITTPRNVNAILSKYKLKKKTTYKLPSCGEARSLDKAIININGVDISYYNTHLSYNIDETKNCPKTHMKYIAKKLKADKNPIILTGDFNSHSIENYEEYLKPLGFEVAAHNHKYLGVNGKESYMDAIYILSKGHIDIINEETVLTYQKYSDHNLVFATFEIKK